MVDAVAFLRGMNVGGHRTTNAELIEVVASLGFAGVSAFQASGNLLLASEGREPTVLEADLRRGLSSHFAYDVPVLVRSADDLATILATDPYGTPDHVPAGKPQIVFFSGEPDAAAIGTLASGHELVVVIERQAYWWPDGGQLDSAIDWQEVNRDHGPLTIRTRATVERLAARLEASA